MGKGSENVDITCLCSLEALLVFTSCRLPCRINQKEDMSYRTIKKVESLNSLCKELMEKSICSAHQQKVLLVLQNAGTVLLGTVLRIHECRLLVPYLLTN